MKKVIQTIKFKMALMSLVLSFLSTSCSKTELSLNNSKENTVTSKSFFPGLELKGESPFKKKCPHRNGVELFPEPSRVIVYNFELYTRVRCKICSRIGLSPYLTDFDNTDYVWNWD